MKRFILSLLLIVTVVSYAEAQQVKTAKTKSPKVVLKKSIADNDKEGDVIVVFNYYKQKVNAYWDYPRYYDGMIISVFINGEKQNIEIFRNSCSFTIPIDAMITTSFKLCLKIGETFMESSTYNLFLETKK